MRESQIERYLVQEVKKLGGEAEKFSSPNRRNVPDRLVTFPGAAIGFVEVKATGKKLRAAQLRDHKRRKKMGFRVYTIDNKLDARRVAELIHRVFI